MVILRPMVQVGMLEGLRGRDVGEIGGGGFAERAAGGGEDEAA